MAAKRKSTTSAKKTARKAVRLPGKSAADNARGETALFELEVFILSGLITAAFAEANEIICRTLVIRGDQTLDDLHHIIFKAFDRFDEHLYEFQFGKGPNDLDGPRYQRSIPAGDDFSDRGSRVGNANTTRLDSLGLTVDHAFGYWFDFGDDWWQQINVLKISPSCPPGAYPRITSRIGESPPQYPDMDEMD